MPRPLLVRFGALGDLILCTPLMRALATQAGQPCDVVAHGRWSPEVLSHLPFVGDVVCLPSRKSPYWFSPDQWRLARWLDYNREELRPFTADRLTGPAV